MVTVSIAVALALATPQARPQPAPANRPVVLGTRQLPGEFGKIGTTYTIGKDAPLNFTLVSAEYRMDRFVGDDGSNIYGWLPRKEEKHLVLRYTVQNPNPRDTRLWYGSLDLIGITADDQNIKQVNRPIIGTQKRAQDVQLKPAQKVTLTALIQVPAEGELPKLMVRRGFEPTAAVIRYDLRGKVSRLPAAVSEDGFTPKAQLDGALDSWFQWPGYDLKVVSFAPIDSPIAALRSEPGTRQWVIRLAVRTVAEKPSRFWYGNFELGIRTEDGDLLTPRVQDRLLRVSTDDAFDRDLPQGEEMSFRMVVDLPERAKPTGIRLAHINRDDRFRPVNIKLTP